MGSDPILVTGIDDVEILKNIEHGFEFWGMHPKCRNCLNRGIHCENGVYDAPGLRFYCVYWRPDVL